MTPRRNWREHVERQLGFVFHTINDAPYWDETACYVFTTGEVDELEAASGELEQMGSNSSTESSGPAMPPIGACVSRSWRGLPSSAAGPVARRISTVVAHTTYIILLEAEI